MGRNEARGYLELESCQGRRARTEALSRRPGPWRPFGCGATPHALGQRRKFWRIVTCSSVNRRNAPRARTGCSGPTATLLQSFAVLFDFEWAHRKTRKDAKARSKKPMSARSIARLLSRPQKSHSINSTSFNPERQQNDRYAQSPRCPVDGVTWYEAAAYCNWLTDNDKATDQERPLLCRERRGLE